jgi:hypothetical protein
MAHEMKELLMCGVGLVGGVGGWEIVSEVGEQNNMFFTF